MRKYKYTKKLDESFPIPLKPYSYYIQENMKLNDILLNDNTIGSPLPRKEQRSYMESLGRNYMKSKLPSKIY